MTTSKQLRETKQRNAIWFVLDSTQRPLSPLEILKLASDEVPRLGIATVYRNIRSMVESGELSTVELPGQPARFTLPAYRQDHVFLDTESDEVYTFEAPAAELRKLLPRGFKANTVTLYATGSIGVTAKRTAKKAVSTPAPTARKTAAKKTAIKKAAAKKTTAKTARKASKKATRKRAS